MSRETNKLVPLRRYPSRRRTRSMLSELAARLPAAAKLALLDSAGQVWLGAPGLASSHPQHDPALEAIRVDADVIGWLHVSGLPEDQRDLVAASLAVSLCVQAELGIETRSLAEETLNRYREINFLYAAGESLRTGSAEYEIAESLLTELLDVLRVEDGLILLPRDLSGYVAARRGTANPELPGALIDELLQITDPLQFPASGPSSTIISSLLQIVDSGLCVPLMYDGRSEGVIVVGAKRENAIYTAGDEKLLGALGEQLALFLQVARLYADLQDRNAALQGALEALKAAQAELLHSERMSALGNVASRVVHDVKGPLGVLKGYAGLISRPDLAPGQAKDFANRMMSSVDDVVAMLEEILDFARGRPDDLEREITPIAPYLEDIAEALRARAGGSDIQVIVAVNQPDLSYDLDPYKFRRVIHNLAGNAIEALAGKGGAI